MNGPQNDGAASAAPGTTTILTSWKEIAGFFGKSVRTVQRWERHFALPVRRPKNAVTGIVLADARELAAWLEQQTRAGAGSAGWPIRPCGRCAELESQVEFLRARCAALEHAAALSAAPLGASRSKRRLPA